MAKKTTKTEAKWGYRKDGKPKKKPGRKKAAKASKAAASVQSAA